MIINLKNLFGILALALLATGCVTDSSDIGAQRMVTLNIEVNKIGQPVGDPSATVYAVTENKWKDMLTSAGAVSEDVATDDIKHSCVTKLLNYKITALGTPCSIDVLPWPTLIIIDYNHTLTLQHGVNPVLAANPLVVNIK